MTTKDDGSWNYMNVTFGDAVSEEDVRRAFREMLNEANDRFPVDTLPALNMAPWSATYDAITTESAKEIAMSLASKTTGITRVYAAPVGTAVTCSCSACRAIDAKFSASDPHAEREARRREIDAVLHEDARRFPAFATARRAAVMAKCEGAPPHPPDEQIAPWLVSEILKWLHEYEAKRGGLTAPSDAAMHFARFTFGEILQGHYERARRLP